MMEWDNEKIKKMFERVWDYMESCSSSSITSSSSSSTDSDIEEEPKEEPFLNEGDFKV